MKRKENQSTLRSADTMPESGATSDQVCSPPSLLT